MNLLYLIWFKSKDFHFRPNSAQARSNIRAFSVSVAKSPPISLIHDGALIYSGLKTSA